MSTKRLTTNEFIIKSKEIYGNSKYDYSLVDYKNNSTKVKLIYNGEIYEQSPMNHFKGFNCENIKKLSQNEFIAKSKEIHGLYRYDYSLVVFKNVRGKIKLIKDGIVYEQLAYAHLQGKCPEQAEVKISKELFIERSIKYHGDKFDYSLVEINSNKDKVKIVYNGKVYEQLASDHMRGTSPKGTISISKGCEKVINYLESNNIQFNQEYKYLDCRNINPLPFDFYLPEYNILIEFDGKQHFEPIEYFGGISEFEKRQINDNIKNEYVKKNRIHLLRISYLDESKIETLIKDFINKLSIM